MDEQFIEYLALAAPDVLSQRECLILDLRFGISDGEPRTLQEVGNHIGVSRERIRQIVERSVRRLRRRAASEGRRGRADAPCAQLLRYLEGTIQPGTPGDIERMREFVQDDAYQTQMLIAGLLPPVQDFLAEVRSRQRQYQAALRADAKTRRAAEKCRTLLGNIAWPRSVRHLALMPYLRRQRDVSPESEGHAGSFYSEKMGRDVQFESTLELQFLLQLESCPDIVAYQEQPLVLQYEHEGRSRQYYPDVFLLFKSGRGAVVELKGKYVFGLQDNLIQWSALRRFCREMGYGLLVTDGRIAIQALLRHEVQPAFRGAVLAALARGPLSWPTYKRIRDQYSPSTQDFQALILQEGLVWRLLPFMLYQRDTAPSQETSRSR